MLQKQTFFILASWIHRLKEAEEGCTDAFKWPQMYSISPLTSDNFIFSFGLMLKKNRMFIFCILDFGIKKVSKKATATTVMKGHHLFPLAFLFTFN